MHLMFKLILNTKFSNLMPATASKEVGTGTTKDHES